MRILRAGDAERDQAGLRVLELVRAVISSDGG
jgi:hypothetical protein